MSDETAGRTDAAPEAWAGAGREALLAALAWQVELGVDVPLGEDFVDRFAEGAARRAAAETARPAAPAARGPASPEARPAGAPARPSPPAPAPLGDADPAAAAVAARDAAAASGDLATLHAAIRAFEGCALKRGARNTVIADGRPGARVMVVGEAPGREEDRVGRPFVGRSGQLLDRMLAAIGLSRGAEEPGAGVYVTNAVYWRPMENRKPSADEVAMLLPFLERHVELAAPDLLLLTGATPAQALFASAEGVARLRGRWVRWRGIPALATFHPAYLLRQPLKKREVWRDLLALRAALDGEEIPA